MILNILWWREIENRVISFGAMDFYIPNLTRFGWFWGVFFKAFLWEKNRFQAPYLDFLTCSFRFRGRKGPLKFFSFFKILAFGFRIFEKVCQGYMRRHKGNLVLQFQVCNLISKATIIFYLFFLFFGQISKLFLNFFSQVLDVFLDGKFKSAIRFFERRIEKP